jgi:hypothetical protein
MARKAMGCGSFEGALSCKDEQQTCSGGMGSLFATLVTLLLLVLGAFPLAAQTAQDGAASLSSGGFYDTPRDLARFRSQASAPELRNVYARIHSDAYDATQLWLVRFPATPSPRPTQELLAAGRASGHRPDGYIPLVLETVLDPTAEHKRVLREMMVFAIGTHQTLNYWSPLGIHESIQVSEFLETYGIANQVGVFTSADHDAIRTEMHGIGHFLEGWLLDNPYSRMYPDRRDTAWCLNFNIMSASTLSWIAMLYPDFSESSRWLRESQSGIIDYLMNGFAEDGAYGEGSDHYWQLATKGLLNFFIVSRNLGVSDYLQVPAIADRMRATMHWRINLTAPDGNQFAIGDSDRSNDAGSFLLEAGSLLDDPQATWAGRMMMERANHWSFRERSLLFFAHLDMQPRGTAATNDNALFPLSGFATFRTGWDQNANAMFFKFGPTYFGRREADRLPVISGHAHEDALELELHYRGEPVIADIGRHGHYEQWATYGGFTKATIAHSTVGLGNPWGYDRLDGKYAQHQAEHGPDFTYEQTQQNIDPADSRLMAYADLGSVVFSSAKVRTFDAAQHQRSLVWFAEDAVTVVADHLESAQPQPYEWYLTPVGRPLGTQGRLVFGDDIAKVEVVPIAPLGERVTTIAQGTPNLPPYYVDLAPSGAGGLASAPKVARDATFSLLILQQKASTTDFLNVLLPFTGANNPWSIERAGSDTRRLRQGRKEVLVAGRDAHGPLALAGECGVLSNEGSTLQSYALLEGTELRSEGKLLLAASLSTPVWKGLYSTTLNALVSLKDHRASFDLRPWPGDQHLLLNPPRAVPGQEPTAVLLTAVSFRVASRPQRMLVFHGFGGQPQFDDPVAKVWDSWPNDWHHGVARRQPLDFTYDPVTGLVTVQLEPGPNQVVWE